jgi:hypothetical protein
LPTISKLTHYQNIFAIDSLKKIGYIPAAPQGASLAHCYLKTKKSGIGVISTVLGQKLGQWVIW